VLRIAREALTNIVRHAQARSVRLGLMYEPEAVTLLVRTTARASIRRPGGQAIASGCAPSRSGRVFSARRSTSTRWPAGAPGSGARFPYRQHDEQAGPRLRVLVAAARPVLRAGLVRLLAGHEPGIEVIGEAGTAEQALEACQDLRPDVVLADLGSVTGLLLGRDPGLAVVGLCEVGAEKLVADAIRAGAPRVARHGRRRPGTPASGGRGPAAARRSCPVPCSGSYIAACRKTSTRRP